VTGTLKPEVMQPSHLTVSGLGPSCSIVFSSRVLFSMISEAALSKTSSHPLTPPLKLIKSCLVLNPTRVVHICPPPPPPILLTRLEVNNLRWKCGLGWLLVAGVLCCSSSEPSSNPSLVTHHAAARSRRWKSTQVKRSPDCNTRVAHNLESKYNR
jgi:hypothetical protein